VTSREALEARLRAALTFDDQPVRDGVDMSPDAITARVRDLCELSALCLELGELTRVRT
jgi:hypothetical protein